MSKQELFISYSRKDSEFVERLVNDLVNQSYKPWLDRRMILGGQKFDREIKQAIHRAKSVLVIISPDSAQSEWVQQEYEYAVANGKKIIPIMLHESILPAAINKFQIVDFSQSYENGLMILLKALKYKPSVREMVISSVNPNEKEFNSNPIIDVVVYILMVYVSVIVSLFCIGMILHLFTFSQEFGVMGIGIAGAIMYITSYYRAIHPVLLGGIIISCMLLYPLFENHLFSIYSLPTPSLSTFTPQINIHWKIDIWVVHLASFPISLGTQAGASMLFAFMGVFSGMMYAISGATIDYEDTFKTRGLGRLNEIIEGGTVGIIAACIVFVIVVLLEFLVVNLPFHFYVSGLEFGMGYGWNIAIYAFILGIVSTVAFVTTGYVTFFANDIDLSIMLRRLGQFADYFRREGSDIYIK